MTLFDPYSHTRINELRLERASRRAKQREALALGDAEFTIAKLPVAAAVRALAARVAHPGKTSEREARRSGAPALDS